MKMRKLGSKGPEVSAVGLGAMGMSDFYGPSDEAEGIRTVHAALDAGITLIDTGDFYGMGHNEMLLSRALEGKRDKVFIQVKFGAQRSPEMDFIGFDGRPAAVKTALAYSLRRLKTDYIDLYQPGRLDPTVPIEETIGAIKECVDKGWVRYIGVSEVGADTIKKANSVHPITGLQREYSLVSRDVEADVLPTLDEIGAGLTAYGILSRGLLSGSWSEANGPTDFRGYLPRFTGDNLKHNLSLVEQLKQLAVDKGATPAQLATAWVLSQGDHIIPLIGARKVSRLEESLRSLDVLLSDDESKKLGEIFSTVKGERYPEPMMQHINAS